MQAVSMQPTGPSKPNLDQSYEKVIKVVKEVEKQFAEKYGEELNFIAANHFQKLHEIFDFEPQKSQHQFQTTLDYTEYDLAQVFIKEFLKRHLDLKMHPDYNEQFVEAIFGKLSYLVPAKYRRADVETLKMLNVIYQEEALDNSLEKIAEAMLDIQKIFNESHTDTEWHNSPFKNVLRYHHAAAMMISRTSFSALAKEISSMAYDSGHEFYS